MNEINFADLGKKINNIALFILALPIIVLFFVGAMILVLIPLIFTVAVESVMKTNDTLFMACLFMLLWLFWILSLPGLSSLVIGK